jgi:hypothetical protein
MNTAGTAHLRTSRRVFVSGLLSGVASLSSAQAALDGSTPLLLAEVAEGIRPGTDITVALDRALQTAQDHQIGELVVPAGDYLVRSVRMRNGVKLKGLGRGSTRLNATPDNAGSFVVLSNGPVIQTAIEGMTLQGGTPTAATNPSQWAIDFEAKPVPGSVPAHGGFWWSFIQDVAVHGFSKGVRFQGGAVPGNYMLPHQFVSFRDLVVYLSQDAQGPALKIAGQVAQFAFDQCHFDHTNGIADFTLVEIGRVGNTSTATGPEPSLLRFNVCTFQDARLAIAMVETQNVSFESCWFEQLQGGIQVGKNCVGVTISGCRFANAGSIEPAVSFLENAHGTVSTNVFAGSQTKSSIHVAPTSRVALSNNIQTLGAGQ